MAITWTPKQFELARAEELALSSRLASSRPWIVSGLVLGVPVSGLDAEVSNGQAYIAGYVVDVDSEDVTVADDATSTVYLGLVVDGNDNVTSATLATTAHVSGYYVTLGTVTAASGDITGVATTGRSPITQVDADIVASVFTRTGAVVAEAGDYDADQIDYDNTASGLAATEVQEAIDELAARPAAGGYEALIVKTADQTLTGNGNDTLQNDNELFFSVGANKTYLVELSAYCDSTSGDSFKIDFTGPSGATMNAQMTRVARTSSATDIYRIFPNIAISTSQVIGVGNAAFWLNCAIILTTSSTAGTFQFRWARVSTGNGGDGIVYKGSVFRYKDIT
jgi:hypothetical protein